MLRSSHSPAVERLAAAARAAVLSRTVAPDIIIAAEALTDVERHAYPWLLLFLARHALYDRSDFAQTAHMLTPALAEFRLRRDVEGMQWAAIEQAFLDYHTRAPAAGAAVIAELGEHLPTAGYLAVALRAAQALCFAGSGEAAQADRSLNLALGALEAEPQPRLRAHGEALTRYAAARLDLTRGAIASARAEAEEALRAAQATVDLPAWCQYMLGLACWRQGDFAAANTAFAATRTIAEELGQRALWSWAVAAQGHVLRDQGDLVGAREAYRLAEHWGDDGEGPAFLFIREGQLAEARWSARTLLAFAEQRGAKLEAADAALLLGLIDLRTGNPQRAKTMLAQAAAIYQAGEYGYRLISAQIYQAVVLLSLGELEQADQALALGLASLAEQDSLNCEWWLPDLIEPLLLRALARGIQPQYAMRLLNRRFLNSISSLTALSPAYHDGPRRVDLELARQTQVGLLPSSAPLVPGLDLAGFSLPAEEVGGDIYGYYPLDPLVITARGYLGLAMADIAGKGLSAALLTSGAAVALATAAVDSPPASEVVSQVQTALRVLSASGQMQLALCYVTLTRDGIGWWAEAVNAGGIAPLLRRADGRIEWIPAHGLPLGSLNNAHRPAATARIAVGDTLLLVSDGVLEAMNPERELFGFERLEQALACAPVGLGARAVVAHVITVVQAHIGNAHQHDDITVVVAIAR